MYIPDKRILKNYAKVLVDFALNSGKGINKGEVVSLQFDTVALPLAHVVYAQILSSGGFPIVRMSDDIFSKELYTHGSNEQLLFFPKKYIRSFVDTVDHRIALLAERDPLYLKDVDPKKIMLSNKNTSLVRKWLFDKEDRGQMTWTLALFGTPGMAEQAGISLEKYWEQIISACFLDAEDPLAKWRTVFKGLEKIRTTLSDMNIQKLHIVAQDTDLWITMGKDRKWLGGGGRNIPSFEIFTSPDWRGTTGHIYFDYPLYRYGNIIRDIHLTFEKGRVIKARASKNESLLKALIAQKNADKIGEYSLTDIRFSRINHFMANTLFDENFGGKWGNTHLAVGTSYHDTYTKDPKTLTAKKLHELGYNESPEHCDIMATHNREVTATLGNGTTKTIYKDGKFTV
ncbi:MAG: aminopeptidase [Candidatus Roizmanbacteria bacterium]|nr:aminopeptidase [Candidatus Roizmanbacteria bacterium]